MDDASTKLADEILSRLINEKLLMESEKVKLIDKLADGKLKPEDWRLAVEMTMDREEKQ